MECELCESEFKPGGLSPVCNLCWNKMAAERDSLKLQLSEVTAHRDRLRDMMNDVRGLLLCPPADLEVQIMRRIEDGAITEKRNCVCGHTWEDHEDPGGECVHARVHGGVKGAYCPCGRFQT